MHSKNLHSALPFVCAASAILLFGCFGDSTNGPGAATRGFLMVNLVSDTTAVPAARVDSNLSNPWGLAVSPTGFFWIVDNQTGMSSIYDPSGAQRAAPVTIPGPDDSTRAAPTG